MLDTVQQKECMYIFIPRHDEEKKLSHFICVKFWQYILTDLKTLSRKLQSERNGYVVGGGIHECARSDGWMLCACSFLQEKNVQLTKYTLDLPWFLLMHTRIYSRKKRVQCPINIVGT